MTREQRSRWHLPVQMGPTNRRLWVRDFQSLIIRPLHTQGWEPVSPWPLHFKHSHWWKGRAGQVRFTLRLRDQRSKWMQHGYKVYMDSYMASNGSCFMVIRTIFKHHLLEVGLTQTGRPWRSRCSQPLIYSILSCTETRMNKDLLK